jgi:hypothetical protein
MEGLAISLPVLGVESGGDELDPEPESEPPEDDEAGAEEEADDEEEEEEDEEDALTSDNFDVPSSDRVFEAALASAVLLLSASSAPSILVSSPSPSVGMPFFDSAELTHLLSFLARADECRLRTEGTMSNGETSDRDDRAGRAAMLS